MSAKKEPTLTSLNDWLDPSAISSRGCSNGIVETVETVEITVTSQSSHSNMSKSFIDLSLRNDEKMSSLDSIQTMPMP